MNKETLRNLKRIPQFRLCGILVTEADNERDNLDEQVKVVWNGGFYKFPESEFWNCAEGDIVEVKGALKAVAGTRMDLLPISVTKLDPEKTDQSIIGRFEAYGAHFAGIRKDSKPPQLEIQVFGGLLKYNLLRGCGIEVDDDAVNAPEQVLTLEPFNKSMTSKTGIRFQVLEILPRHLKALKKKSAQKPEQREGSTPT